MTTQRLNLNAKSITEQPVGEEFPGTFYSWDPKTRVLDIYYYGVHQEFKIAPDIVGVLVHMEGKGIKLIELHPPRHPVALVAFNFGFFRPRRAMSVREARAAASLAQQKDGPPPLIVVCKRAIFVYEQRQKGCGLKRIPFRWAAEKGADPVEIAKMLGTLP